jgi:preprotein translocase SecE subunit
MAVALKNSPDVSSSSLMDRLAAVSLAGTLYVLGCIGIVFYLIPSLWWMGWDRHSYPALAGLAFVMLAAAGGLAVLGVRLLGPKAVPGVRAGIFAGLCGFILVLLLTRWVSMWIEYLVYTQDVFGPNGPSIGAAITAVVGLLLLGLLVRQFFRPRFEQTLINFEAQGWFTAKAYKPLQGLRVRRGTIFGILVLVAAGIYTLLTHGTLQHGPRNWELNIPFTGRVEITNPGDGPNLEPGALVDRMTLRAINGNLDPARYVKIYDTGSSKFKVGEIVPREEFQAEVERLKRDNLTPPTSRDPVPASGQTVYASLILLPSLPLTIPLLLLAAALWVAWRIVNMPIFADFLIATEAELNKVSWTTQRRLIQDTVVVLVTVVLMSAFLFLMDQGWRVLLSWKPIGVLQIQEEQTESNANPENRPW